MEKLIPFPDRQYDVIYADPPWSYKQSGNGAAKHHYTTMTTEDICNLPVRKLCGGGGLPASYGQHSQTLKMPSKLWRHGDSGIRLPPLCGSKRTLKAAGTIWGWALTPVQTRRCACWVYLLDSRPRRGSEAIVCGKSLKLHGRGTAGSRMKQGGGSWNCWETYHE